MYLKEWRDFKILYSITSQPAPAAKRTFTGLVFTIIIKKPIFQFYFTACAVGGERAPCLGAFQALRLSGGGVVVLYIAPSSSSTDSHPLGIDSRPLSPLLASPQLCPPGIFQTEPNSRLKQSQRGLCGDSQPGHPQSSPYPSLRIWVTPPGMEHGQHRRTPAHLPGGSGDPIVK